MKLHHSIALSAIALSLAAARAQEVKLNIPGQENQPAGSAVPAASAPSYTSQQIAEELGWIYGKKMGLSELGFSPAETEAVLKGFTAAANGKDTPFDVEKMDPLLRQFMQQKQTAYVERLKQKNVSDNAAFFAKLKENKNIIETPSGLRYEIVKPGEGAFPKPEDKVKVQYTGTLLDGTVFDSSAQHGGQPAEFQLNQVIPGWTEGIQKVNKGGKIRLYIPPQLAYGEQGNQGIPPNAALVFDVELVDITPAAPSAVPAPAEAPATK